MCRAVFTFIAEGLITSADALRVLPMSGKEPVFIDAFKAFKKHCPKDCPKDRYLPVWDDISIDHYLGTVNNDERIFVSQRIGNIIDQHKLDTFIVDLIEIELLMLKHPKAERIVFDHDVVGLVVPITDDFNIKFATTSTNGKPSLWELRYTKTDK